MTKSKDRVTTILSTDLIGTLPSKTGSVGSIGSTGSVKKVKVAPFRKTDNYIPMMVTSKTTSKGGSKGSVEVKNVQYR